MSRGNWTRLAGDRMAGFKIVAVVNKGVVKPDIEDVYYGHKFDEVPCSIDSEGKIDSQYGITPGDINFHRLSLRVHRSSDPITAISRERPLRFRTDNEKNYFYSLRRDQGRFLPIYAITVDKQKNVTIEEIALPSIEESLYVKRRVIFDALIRDTESMEEVKSYLPSSQHHLAYAVFFAFQVLAGEKKIEQYQRRPHTDAVPTPEKSAKKTKSTSQ